MIGRLITAGLAALTLAASASGAPLVAIDPGHGGADSGAVGVLPPGTPTGLPTRINPQTGETNIYEKDVNLDVAWRLDAYLRARGLATVMTRTTDNAGGDVPFTTVSADLRARVQVAEERQATLFVSLHENALGATTSGTETYHYYYASENSKVLARMIQENLVTALGLPDRGVQSSGFYVLKYTSMPAVLVEGMFLSNPTEAQMLASATTRQAIASAVGAAVVTYFQKGYGTTPVVTSTPRYQVNVGVYRKLASARIRARLARARGYSVVIRSQWSPRHKRRMFVVVGGRFAQLDNARTLRDGMRAKELPAMIGPVRSGRTVPG